MSPRLPSVLAAALMLGGSLTATGQSSVKGRTQVLLERVFPTALSFSDKEPAPPHYKVYGKDRTLLGVAFWTTEIEPLERGYDGPIKILVGLDMKGVVTGIAVAEHHEPYGYFSVDRPEFAEQFAGKSVRDAFKVGADIAAVSRASISMASATRAIRNSSRRIARQLLPPPPAP
jgi:NosR/NirI family nitrous oxide reductase transcriptional regulator